MQLTRSPAVAEKVKR